MNKFNEFMKLFYEVPRNIKLILIATLITNIGNGMHTIAVSKLLYDKTGTAMAFGGVLILDNVISFIFQFISGSVVDRINTKKVSIICDLIRGVVIIFVGIMVNYSHNGIYFLIVSLVVVNVVNPFYRSANFKLVPMLIEDSSKLLKINGIAGVLFQTGQLLGVALVAPILYFFNPGLALIIDGLTFMFSAIMTSFIIIKVSKNIVAESNIKANVSNKLYNDWKEIFCVLKNEKSLIAHISLSSGDYLSVSFINLLLVPMVTQWYNNNSFCISLFDGSFAIGAISSVYLLYKIYDRMGIEMSSWIGLLTQGIIFFIIMINRNTIITILMMFSLGMFNAFSISVFQTSLQLRVDTAIKGRISSLRNIIVYTLSLILIPIITKIMDYSLSIGIIIVAIIVSFYGLLSVIISKSKLFGENYLQSNNI
ncbi:Na+/melibiose symporter [Clostridium cavendishii DSM 21758]|uniref:Na+/melibiose symporter n=1 Tax=Clostridium cavendishii DSM 21758 TaxID=1121302 RepID=A0A1M6D6Y0_9CLOT|nr:MFS transporter [Clostridium cavendishii]SHI68972.1 Na+/melibiose symporter [Clostridium cavendishii DSM 21758]